jgi:deazaflavin-dependent oxidoreductase (nitroreductase family)
MWFNPIMEWVLKSPVHAMLSGNTMIIHYTGRKSGKAYHLPVGYQQADGALLTTSSRKRTWWRNLRGGVSVTILLKGKMVSAHAQVVEDDQEVADSLIKFIKTNPRAARMFGVMLGTDGQPELESLKKAARERVIVRTTIE